MLALLKTRAAAAVAVAPRQQHDLATLPLPSSMAASALPFHSSSLPLYKRLPAGCFLLVPSVPQYGHILNLGHLPFILRVSKLTRDHRAAVTCIAAGDGGRDGPKAPGAELKSLLGKLLPQDDYGEKLMRMVAGATSAPIAQYIAAPISPLHSLDPRVKQAWLLALVVLPSRSHMAVRLGLVIFLALVSIWALPRSTWQDQLGRMAFLSGILLIMVSFGTDGVPPLVQTRTPPPAMDGLPVLPRALAGYSYVLWKMGPLQLTRKGLSLGATACCLSFTVLQSASLCLTTTTPEQLAAALRWYLTPLVHCGAPVDELVLTLLLSLRFVGLVFDEVRNTALAIVARGVQWKNLTLLETADVFFIFLGRIFKNLFNHSEQIAQAMIARGFKGNATKHKIYFLTTFSIRAGDYAAICILAGLVAAAILSEFLLC